MEKKNISSGYDATYSFTPKISPVVIPNPHEVLTISPDKITLTTGLIDIVGYGKGVAIDLLATTLLSEYKIQYFLINGDGDIFGTNNHKTPITIYLEHPTDTGTYLGTTTIFNQGFAASSHYKRLWTYKNVKFSHIIDTIDGAVLAKRPDACFITATTTIADVFATIALIAPSERYVQFVMTYQLTIATYTLPPYTSTKSSLYPTTLTRT